LGRLEAKRLASHLESCPECRWEAWQLAAVAEALPGLLAELAPCGASAAAKSRLMASLRLPAIPAGTGAGWPEGVPQAMHSPSPRWTTKSSRRPKS